MTIVVKSMATSGVEGFMVEVEASTIKGQQQGKKACKKQTIFMRVSGVLPNVHITNPNGQVYDTKRSYSGPNSHRKVFLSLTA